MDRLRIAAHGSMWFAGLALVYTILVHPTLVPVQLGIVGALACCALVHHLTVRRKIAHRAVSAVGTLMMANAIGVSAWGFVAADSIDFAILISVLMIAAGVLHLYRRWLLVNLGLTLGVWASAGFATHGSRFASYFLGLCMFAVIAIMIHEITTRYLIALEELRIRDKDSEVERQALREQLFHSQKLESLGTLAGGVAHDMNNVLAVIVGSAESIREQVAEPLRADVDELLCAAERGAELTKNLLGFSRRGTYRREVIDVGNLVGSVASLLRRTLPKSVSLEVVGQPEASIEGDSSRLTHALMNLCLNAADAMGGSGQLTITLAETHVDEARARALVIGEGRYTTIAVADTGAGIPPDVQARIFEPFYTTKPLGKGTGLGLAMVYGTVKSHRGAISVETELGAGTTFTLFVPAVESEPRPSATAQPVLTGRGTILVVDDEELIRATTCRMLERSGFRTLSAKHGREGVEVFDRHSGMVDLVLLDMAMPVMSGSECFHQLRQRAPSVKVLLVSGYAQEHEAEACLDQGAVGFLEKPYRGRALVELVTTLIGAPSNARVDTHALLP